MATEQTFNINFVLEVENYPCLYNYKLPEYVRKDVTEKAWIEIGKKINLTCVQCKEKWRNIRNVFVRNMKPGKSGAGVKKKPYYLNEVMQFTLPFIKLSKASVSGNLEKPPIDEMNQPDIDELTDDEDRSQPVLNNFLNNAHMLNETEHRPIPTPSPHSSSVSVPATSPLSPYSVPTPTPESRRSPTPSPHSSSVSVPTLSKKKNRKTKNSTDESILDYFKAKQARAETIEHHSQNPKRMFLLSLLPDLEPMSDGQMKKFKRGVLQLIDDILEHTPTTTSSIDNSQVTLYYETVEQDLTAPLNESP